MSLSSYAEAHLRLIGIHARWRELLGRKPNLVWHGSGWATRVASEARQLLGYDQQQFDALVHGHAAGDARMQGMEHAP